MESELSELKPGDALGKLNLVEKLPDQYGLDTWLAKEQDSGQQFKVLIATNCGADLRGQLIERLESLASLTHPAVHSRFDWADASIAVIKVDNLAGLTAFRPANTDLDFILAAGIRVSEILQHAHSQGIFHGGLTASALLRNAAGKLQLTDFSLDPDSYKHSQNDFQSIARLLSNWCDELDNSHPRTAENEVLLPPRLKRLISSLRSENPPGSMADVRDELDDIRLQWQRAVREGIPETWLYDDIEEHIPAPAIIAEATNDTGRSRAIWPLVSILIAVLLIASALVIPRLLTEPAPALAETATVEAPEPEQPAEPEPKPLTEEDLKLLLAQRQEAQAVLDEVLQRKLDLEAMKVELWAPKLFMEANATRDNGDIEYKNQKFPAAVEHYQAALTQMTELIDLSNREIDEALAAGNEALLRGDSEGATEAFNLALQIEPENTDATAGLKRAEVLDQVLATVAEARAHEDNDQPRLAREKYREALKLDPETAGLNEAIARLDDEITGIAFTDAMSLALAALDAGNLSEASAQFNAAKALRPGSTGPAEGLQEIARRTKQAKLQQDYQLTEILVREERWSEAVTAFDSMLKKDPNLSYALAGRAEASDRADLDVRLAQYTADPVSWWTLKGRNEAQALLAEAGTLPNPGSRLRTQIETLGQQIEEAAREIPITLVSDNLCDVIVYKVARLGRFSKQDLVLNPGRYTVVGTRDGYRDVRLNIVVPPEPPPEPYSVQCNQQVNDAL